MTLPLPTLCFAHAAYQLAEEFGTRARDAQVLVARTLDELAAAIDRAEVLCVSGLWRPELLARAPRLRMIQATSVGVDQFDLAALRARGVRLCNARGLNAEAVAEHGIALMLSVARHLTPARDRQRQGQWRPMIADRGRRERELRGATVLIVGLGAIGGRLAALAQAFGMRVIGVRRDTARGGLAGVDRLVATDALHEVLPEADFVCLTCPLTAATERLIDGRALAAMKPDAWVVNLARGRVVDEAALIGALERGAIGGAALDCTEQEPLPSASPLWRMDNVVITPHSAGETRDFEARIIDQLLANLDNEAAGRPLVNEVTA